MLRPVIYGELESLIHDGVDEFYTGGMGDFDYMCESCVRGLKWYYPNIKLYLVSPYLTTRMNGDPEYYRENYDHIIIPDLGDIYFKQAITKRNEWLAEECDVILCNVNRDGGAKRMMNYAEKLNKKIINFSEIKEFYE
jgi:uncharacterized phage-like protein YoqJ